MSALSTGPHIVQSWSKYRNDLGKVCVIWDCSKVSVRYWTGSNRASSEVVWGNWDRLLGHTLPWTRFKLHRCSLDSSVGIATSYGLNGQGWIPGSARLFSSPQCPNRLWGPTSLLSIGYQGLFPRGMKRQGHEADYLPPSRAEVKKGEALPPLLHMSSWHIA
jgi:hypothetical protein